MFQAVLVFVEQVLPPHQAHREFFFFGIAPPDVHHTGSRRDDDGIEMPTEMLELRVMVDAALLPTHAILCELLQRFPKCVEVSGRVDNDSVQYLARAK
jgi:hypothetical protein